MAYTKQTWENAPSTNSPLSADRLNHMEDGIDNAYKQIKNSYNASTTDSYSCNYINNMNGTILWTNSNPTSDFASQSITLDSNNCDKFDIIFSYSTNGSPCLTTTLYNNANLNSTALIRLSTSANNLASRQATLTNQTTINFGDAYFNGNVGNNNNIPIMVIGYETGLFS